MYKPKYPLNPKTYPLPIRVGDEVSTHGYVYVGVVVEINGNYLKIRTAPSKFAERRKDTVITTKRVEPSTSTALAAPLPPAATRYLEA